MAAGLAAQDTISYSLHLQSIVLSCKEPSQRKTHRKRLACVVASRHAEIGMSVVGVHVNQFAPANAREARSDLLRGYIQ